MATTHALLDRESALRYLSGNEALYSKLLGEFLSRNSADAKQIDDLLQSGNVEGARRVSHTLKGLAMTLGANRCHVVAREVDDVLKAQGTPTREQIGALAEVISDTCAEMQKYTVPVDHPSAVSRDDLVELRTLLQEMDPAVDDRLAVMMPALQKLVGNAAQSLAAQVEQFEFEQALVSLDKIIAHCDLSAGQKP